MPSKKAPKVTEGVCEFIASQDFYKNRAWKFRPGDEEMTTVFEGKEMKQSEFLKRFPIKFPANFYHQQKKNPDKTKEFIYT